MSAASGLAVIISAKEQDPPIWCRFVDGEVVARSKSGALAAQGGHGDADPVMLVIPSSLVTVRQVDLPEDMPVAQIRTVAARLAGEASILETDGLLAASAAQDPRSVAIIARDDLAHVITWARHEGIDPDIIIPAAAVLPEAEDGVASAEIAGSQVVRGAGLVAEVDGWTMPMLGNAPIRRLSAAEVERALAASLATPAFNLRAGEFAKVLRSDIGPDYLKRIAMWTGFIALATLLISLALIVRFHISTARIDDRTLEVARSVLPAANDAVLVNEELDRLLDQRGGSGYGFTGPLSGLMTAMQPTPSVSLTAFSKGEDGLIHATLASARADDINTVLIAVQAAGYSITATSSADPSGRVIAEITVAP